MRDFIVTDTKGQYVPLIVNATTADEAIRAVAAHMRWQRRAFARRSSPGSLYGRWAVARYGGAVIFDVQPFDPSDWGQQHFVRVDRNGRFVRLIGHQAVTA